MKYGRQPIKRITTVEEIFENCTPEPNNGCWIWLGPYRKDGYAKFPGFRGNGGRAAWIIANGMDLPPSRPYACHRCDVKACVNPDHIYAGTPRENALDAVRNGKRKGCGRPKGSRAWKNYTAEERAALEDRWKALASQVPVP